MFVRTVNLPVRNATTPLLLALLAGGTKPFPFGLIMVAYHKPNVIMDISHTPQMARVTHVPLNVLNVSL